MSDAAQDPGTAEEAFDYVGIAIARSVEGDAIADAMREVEGVEVLEQHTYWEVKARARMRMDFEYLADATGLDVDASLIQVLMSTYYGRMINTDEAILLIHDPIEAMEAM
ncbi:MAG: MmoB/DmpM family protein [Solirubrobacteraceae bacterium]